MMKKLFSFLFLCLISINCLAAPNTMYTSVAGAGTKDGLTPANAFSIVEFLNDFLTGAEAGDQYYVESGTYAAIAHSWTARDGNATAFIKITGVTNLTTLDMATGDDRPLFAMGVYSMLFDDYWEIMNIRATGSYTGYVWRGDTYATFINCKSENTGLGEAFEGGSVFLRMILCEAETANGPAVTLGGNGSFFWGNYFHDSDTGVDFASRDSNFLLFTIIETCTLGADLTGGSTNNFIQNDTFWNNATALSLQISTGSIVINNNFDTNTIGVTNADASADATIYADCNNYFASPVTRFTKGINATSVDSEFVDAPNGNFALGNAMAALGCPNVFPGNLSTGYMEAGAVQLQNSTVLTVPTFAGLKYMPPVGGGMLWIEWDTATDHTGYNIYERVGSADDIFTPTYFKCKVDADSLGYMIRTEADNETFLTSQQAVFVAVRSENNGVEDSNTVIYSVTPHGDGYTYVKQEVIGIIH